MEFFGVEIMVQFMNENDCIKIIKVSLPNDDIQRDLRYIIKDEIAEQIQHFLEWKHLNKTA